MEKESNKTSTQNTSIFNGTEDEVIKNLDNLRETGSLTSLETMLERVVSHPSERIRKKIFELIADIKSNSATAIIANFTFACKNKQAQMELISACWQGRLDFSDYLERYIDLAIQGELLLVNEILTLVEENCEKPELTRIESAIAKIKEQLHSFSSEKKLMMVDLVTILEAKKENL